MAKKKFDLFKQDKKGSSYTPKWNAPKNKDHLWRMKRALKGK